MVDIETRLEGIARYAHKQDDMELKIGYLLQLKPDLTII